MSRSRTFAVQPLTQQTAAPGLAPAIDIRRVPGIAAANPSQVAELDRADEAAARQQAADERAQAVMQRRQQSELERQQKESETLKLKQDNAVKEADFRGRGVENYTDAFGAIKPVVDETGKEKLTDRTGKPQWDATGKAFRTVRQDGQTRVEPLDAGAKIAPDPADKDGKYIYKQNEHSPWDTIDPEAGLGSPDAKVQLASAAHLKAKRARELATRIKELDIEDTGSDKPTDTEVKNAQLMGADNPEAAKVLADRAAFEKRRAETLKLKKEELALSNEDEATFSKRYLDEKRKSFATPGEQTEFEGRLSRTVADHVGGIQARDAALKAEADALKAASDSLARDKAQGINGQNEADIAGRHAALVNKQDELRARMEAHQKDVEGFNKWRSAQVEDAQKAQAAAKVAGAPLTPPQTPEAAADAALTPADFKAAKAGLPFKEKDAGILYEGDVNKLPSVLKAPGLAGKEIYLRGKSDGIDVIETGESIKQKDDNGREFNQFNVTGKRFPGAEDAALPTSGDTGRSAIRGKATVEEARAIAKPEIEALTQEADFLTKEAELNAKTTQDKHRQLSESVAAGKMTGDELNAVLAKDAEAFQNEMAPRREAAFTKLAEMRRQAFNGVVPINTVVDLYRKAGIEIKDMPDVSTVMDAAAKDSDNDPAAQKKREKALVDYVNEYSDQPLYDEAKVAGLLAVASDDVKGAAIRALPWYKRWSLTAGNIGLGVAKIIPSTMQFVNGLTGRTDKAIDWRKDEQLLNEWTARRGSTYLGEPDKFWSGATVTKTLEGVLPSVIESMAYTAAGAVIGTAAAPGPGTAGGSLAGIGGFLTRIAARNAIKAEAAAMVKAAGGKLAMQAAERTATQKVMAGLVRETKAGVPGAMTDAVVSQARQAFGRWGMGLASMRGNAGEYLSNALDGVTMDQLEADPDILNRALAPAVLMGVPAGMLDVVGPLAGADKMLLKKFFPGMAATSAQEIRKTGMAAAAKIMKEAAGDISKEYLTGFGQGALGVIAQRMFEGKTVDAPLNDKEWNSVLDNAALEAAGGGIMTGIGSAKSAAGDYMGKVAIMRSNRDMQKAQARADAVVNATPEELATTISDKTGETFTAADVTAATALSSPPAAAGDVAGIDAALVTVDESFKKAFAEGNWKAAAALKRQATQLHDMRRQAAETHVYQAARAARELGEAGQRAGVVMQQAQASGDQAAMEAAQAGMDAVNRAFAVARVANGADVATLPDVELRAIGYERGPDGKPKAIKGAVPAVTASPEGGWIITDAAIAEAETVSPAVRGMVKMDERTARIRSAAKAMQAAAKAAAPTVAKNATVQQTGRSWEVTVAAADGTESTVTVQAESESKARADVAGRGIGMVRGAVEISSAPQGGVTSGEANATQGEPGRGSGLFPHETKPAGKIEEIARTFGGLFTNIAREKGTGETNGVGFKDGILTIYESDLNDAVQLAADPDKLMLALVAEEAIHAASVALEKSGNLNLSRLWKKLPDGVRKAFNEAYPTDNEYSARHEFIRMIVQGKVKFEANGITVDGELSEMQMKPEVLGMLEAFLRDLVAFIRNLQSGLSQEMAAEVDAAAAQVVAAMEDLKRIKNEAGKAESNENAPQVTNPALGKAKEKAAEWDRANRNRRAYAWHTGANLNGVDEDGDAGGAQGFVDAQAQGGDTLGAHGMSKSGTLSGAIDSLMSMLTDGLDPNRNGGELFTASLTAQKGGGGTTPGGYAYRDGPLILVARPGSEAMNGKLESVGAILVNEAHTSVIEALRAAVHAVRPDIIVDSYSNAGNVAASLHSKTAAKPKAPQVTNPVSKAGTSKGWELFPQSSGTLGIARDKMPQISADQRGALSNFLRARGIEWERMTVDPGALRPSQSEYSPEKVEKAKNFDQQNRAILVSSDGYIVDGHHQWMAAKEKGEQIEIIRLGARIDRVLATVAEFPSAETSKGKKPDPVPGTTPAAKPAIAGTVEGDATTITANGTTVNARWVVQEASEARPSHDSQGNATPGYDQTLQPRDRSLPEYRKQAANIARNLDFAQAAYFPGTTTPATTAEYGAPVMTVSGDTIIGNGREIGTVLAYSNGEESAADYRQNLIDNAAGFGMDPESVAAMKQPILKRLITDKLDTAALRAFSQESNEGAAMSTNAVELAGQDASRITPEILELLDPEYDVDAKQNRAFLTAYAQQVIKGGGSNEVNLTPSELARRARMGIFAAAYGLDAEGRAALDRMSGDSDDGAKKITRALQTVAPLIARMRRDIEAGMLHDRDISREMGAAVQRIAVELRDQKKAADAWTALSGDQMEMSLGDVSDLEKSIRLFLVENRGDRGRIEEAISDYVESVYNLGDPRQGDMFGASPADRQTLTSDALRVKGEVVPTKAVWNDTVRNLPMEEPVAAPVVDTVTPAAEPLKKRVRNTKKATEKAPDKAKKAAKAQVQQAIEAADIPADDKAVLKAEAVWRMFGSVDPELPATVAWNAIYEKMDAPEPAKTDVPEADFGNNRNAPLTLENQTDAEIEAERQRQAEADKAKAQKDAMAARLNAPLTGRDTTGQGALFADDPANDLFSGPAAEDMATAEVPAPVGESVRRKPKAADDSGQRRAKPGGEMGPNGEWYPGGAFIATTEEPKGEVSPSGKKESSEAPEVSNEVAEPEEAPEASYEVEDTTELDEAETLTLEEAEKALNKRGITLTQKSTKGGTPVWHITGKTFDVKDALKGLGAKWYAPAKAWTLFTDENPTIKLASTLAGIAAPASQSESIEDAAGSGNGTDEDLRLRQLRKQLDGSPDGRRDRGDAIAAVDAGTAALIRRGLNFGMPASVVEDQIEDIAMISAAFESGKPAFLLGNGAGTGKTFVLGGAIREMSARGAKDFIYVTMNQDLIEQIKKDLADFGINDVRFHTYSEMSTKDIEVPFGAVLIFDESHNIKNADAARGGKAQPMMGVAKFTIFASATPFENPVQAEYLGGTGIFNSAGGHVEWGKAYGATVIRRKFYNSRTGRQEVEESLRWNAGKLEDGIAARQWFVKQGIMVTRPMQLPMEMVDSSFSKRPVTEEWVTLYNRVEQAYEDAMSNYRNEDGTIVDAQKNAQVAMHMTNTIKRILEAAKVDHAVEDAQKILAGSDKDGNPHNAVIFVETKADRWIGRYKASEVYAKRGKDSEHYTYPEMVRMMAEWAQEAAMAKAMRERPGPRPFAEFIMHIAAAMHSADIEVELPSVEQEIVQRLGGPEKVAIYTGSVSNMKARADKEAFLRGEKRVIVATMAKGSTGLSLHDKVGNRKTFQLNINLPWVATGVDQVSGRVARYGLQSKASINWLFADNIPFERALARRVGRRMRDMGALVKGIDTKAANVLVDNFDFEGSTDIKQVDGEVQPVAEDIFEQAARLEKNRGKASDTSNGFFETPFPLAALMTEISGARGHLLEPSGGTGNLVKFARGNKAVKSITIGELRDDNFNKLVEMFGGADGANAGQTHNIKKGDFLELLQSKAPYGFAGKYNTIHMNPPFERKAGVGYQDAAHVTAAFDLLAPDGRLVAIMGEGSFFRDGAQDKAFRQFLSDHGAIVIKLPENAFKNSGTGVRTRMVVLDAGAPAGRTDMDLSDMDPDSLRDIAESVPARADASLKSQPLAERARRDAEYMAAVEAGDMETAQRMVDAAARKWIETAPAIKAGDDSDGRTVTGEPPNAGSIGASLNDWESFGIRDVPYGWVVGTPGKEQRLAEAIQESGEIAPLIIVVDGHKDGAAYVLEGAHRIDALATIGAKSFPALVIYDKSSDPVTRDDSGNVIPLSRRFNPESDSILNSQPLTARHKAALKARNALLKKPELTTTQRASLRTAESVILAEEKAAGQSFMFPEAMGLPVRYEQMALLSQSFRQMLRNAGVDLGALDAATDAARSEKPGERTVGNPALSLSTLDPVIMGFDSVREIEAQTIEGWDEQARAMLRADYGGTVQKLMEYGRIGTGTLDPVMTRAAQMIVERESHKKMTPAQTARMQWLVWSYRLSGTEQARALGSRRDPFKTPVERHREFLMKAIYTPSPAARKAIENADGFAEKQRLFNEQAAEIEKVKRELARMGVSLDDLFSGEVALMLKNDPIIQSLTAKLDPRRKQAVSMIQDGLSFAEVAKATGLTQEAVKSTKNDVRAKFIDETMKKLRAMRERSRDSLKSQRMTGGLVDAAALAAMNDADAEAAMREIAEKMALQAGFIPDAKQGRMKKVKRKPLFRPPPVRAREAPAATPIDVLGRPVPRTGFGVQPRLEGTTPPAYEGGTPGPGMNQRGRLDLGDLDADETFTGDASEWGRRLFPDAPAWEGEMLIPVGADLADVADVMKAARAVQAAKATGFDMLLEFWVNNLLSGPTTHIRNVAGNLASLLWDFTFQRGTELLVNRVVGGKKDAKMGEMRHLWKGLMPGISRGWRLAMHAWEHESDFFHKDVMDQDTYFEGFGAKGEGPGIAIGGKVGRVVRVPARLLMLMDSLFKGIVGQMEAGAQAYRIATAKGLKGEEHAKEMRVQLNTPGSQAWQLAVLKAEESTFQSKLRKMNDHAGKLSGPVGLAARSLEHAARGVQDTKTGVKLLSLLLPFVRTPYNILRTGIRKSPIGAALLIEEIISGGFAKIKNGKLMTDTHPEVVKHLAEQMIAWTAASVLAGASEGDDDDESKWLLITGTRERQAKGDLQERTFPATTIRLFGHSFNYGSVEPLATALSVFADGVKIMKGGGTAAEKVVAMQRSFRGQIDSKTFLEGLSSAMETMQREGTWENKAKRFVLNGLVPNLIRQPLRAMDGTVRDPKDADWWYDALPLGSAAPPRVNQMTGADVQKPGNGLTRLLFPFLSNPPEKITDADRMLTAWNRERPKDAYAPGAPSREFTIEGKTYTLKPAAYDQLQRRAAALAAKQMPRYNPKVDERIKELIEKAFENGRKMALMELKGRGLAAIADPK